MCVSVCLSILSSWTVTFWKAETGLVMLFVWNIWWVLSPVLEKVEFYRLSMFVST